MATTEQKLERELHAQRVRRRMKAGMTREEAEEADRGSRSERAAREPQHDADAERRAAAWNQMLRIEKYLPVLRGQREEADRHLREIDDLIRDEEQEVSRIRAAIK